MENKSDKHIVMTSNKFYEGGFNVPGRLLTMDNTYKYSISCSRPGLYFSQKENSVSATDKLFAAKTFGRTAWGVANVL